MVTFTPIREPTSCPPMLVMETLVAVVLCTVNATVFDFSIVPAMPNTKLAMTAARMTVNAYQKHIA